ncbi:MAG: ribosome maturation factor RimP [Tissierellia bacterium]|nr:ribosome maturation factor RimP [Tissierellia bacterium]
MSRRNVLKIVGEHCKPIVEGLGYDLVDLEYVRENNRYFLRFYIGKLGGISIDDCQVVSEQVGAKLDELDLIEDSYYLEVSSPGLDRPLETDRDLARNKGEQIEISLYKQLDGKKRYIGKLVGFSDEHVIIADDASGAKEINRDIIANIKLSIEL